jgi:hypothetical protein
MLLTRFPSLPPLKLCLRLLPPTSTLTLRCLLPTRPRSLPMAFPLTLPSFPLTLLRLRLALLRSPLKLLRPFLTLWTLLRLLPRTPLTRVRTPLTRLPSLPTPKLHLRLLLPTTLRACSSHCYVACNRALPGRRQTVDNEVSVGVGILLLPRVGPFFGVRTTPRRSSPVCASHLAASTSDLPHMRY